MMKCNLYSYHTNTHTHTNECIHHYMHAQRNSHRDTHTVCADTHLVQTHPGWRHWAQAPAARTSGHPVKPGEWGPCPPVTLAADSNYQTKEQKQATEVMYTAKINLVPCYCSLPTHAVLCHKELVVGLGVLLLVSTALGHLGTTLTRSYLLSQNTSRTDKSDIRCQVVEAVA